MANILLAVFSFFNLVYDILTLPFYHCAQKPSRQRRQRRQVKSTKVCQSENEITYQSTNTSEAELIKHIKEEQVDTLHKLFEMTYQDATNINKPLVGSRKVIRMETENDNLTGKELRKMVLGDYEWTTMKEVAESASYFGRGLRELDVPAKARVAIFADTRAEWLIAARGCFQHSMSLCTLYTNLGMDAIKYGITLTEAKVVITSQELLPKVASCLPDLENVNLIVVFEEPWRGEIPNLAEMNPKVQNQVKLVTYTEVVKMGSISTIDLTPPEANDPAVIMFTSGSTGVPKGVIQSHANLVSAFMSTCNFMMTITNGVIRDDETYVAFLPLAHILEFLAENVMLLLGIRIGYSSPFTLTDSGTALKRGTKGDLAVLKPTLMSAVPVILDRMYKGIIAKIQAKGALAYKLFDFAIQYRSLWTQRGYSTPLFDKLLFSKVREATGGRLTYMVAGGAPLSETTHEFVKQALGIELLQGYGLTETCATAAIMDSNHLGVGTVGAPLMNVGLKLRSWEEGNYTIHDGVGPRGEIIIGGKHIAEGYFKMPEATAESFEIDCKGVRWFQTGDIGQMMPNGTLKIIDRKKDLVKLQAGEYVSLGKVESILKLHPLIDNICVFARSSENFSVAIVVPSRTELTKFSKEVVYKTGFTEEQLALDRSVMDAISQAMMTFGLAKGLQKFEVPRKFGLVFDEWTPDSGLVTAAMKLRRRPVEDKFTDLIASLYAELNSSSSSGGNELNNNITAQVKKSGKVSPI